ncbi:MAG: protein-export chaperone SecB [Kistimonas sp.]|nr:protein-export chaperone SecB [Kistimonas sp.]
MADNDTQEKKPQFAIQRIYTKDISFESPRSPDVFKGSWQPEVNLDINTSNQKLDEDNLHEVVLKLTATARQGQETAFVAEVKQAGIFLTQDIPEDEMPRTLGAFCPSILFPYAREVIDSLITRGSFPPLMISPVNFDALYTQASKQEAET